ncbi:MAG: hypothetical protein EP343_12755 [Deltaproteobacteria bacterium]|nr:MAG: hypothetical protein EP343_12755 [Deltaproteobacteria bacterium]
MHRFGEQIEFRIDRRQIFLLFLGGLFWTLLSFFLGMMAAQQGSVKKHLVALGWWDEPASRQPQKSGLEPGRAQVSFVINNRGGSQKKPSDRSEEKKPKQRKAASPPPVQRLRSLDDKGESKPQKRPKPARRRQPVQDDPPEDRGSYQKPPKRNVARASKAAYNVAEHNTLSLLEQARAFRRANEKKAKPSSAVNRICGNQLKPEQGRFAIVVGTKPSLRDIRRWRRRLGQQGYFSRIKRVRLKGKRRFRLVMGRFRNQTQAHHCMDLFRQHYKLPGSVMALAKMR